MDGHGTGLPMQSLHNWSLRNSVLPGQTRRKLCNVWTTAAPSRRAARYTEGDITGKVLWKCATSLLFSRTRVRTASAVLGFHIVFRASSNLPVLLMESL